MSERVCDAMSEELVAFLDGEQTESERARVESHVASCLICRREIERIKRVGALLAALPRVEPSAGFDERMWSRLRADAPAAVRGRSFRPALLGVPVLAAAAAIALALYSLLSDVGTKELSLRAGGPAVAVAPGEAERPGSAAAGRAGGGRGDEVALAAAPKSPREVMMRPEDLPPEVLEHPEFFLRYPVVRRLKKLEHFEQVRQRVEQEHRGHLGWRPRPVG